MKTDIVIVQRIFPHYRKAIFDLIHKKYSMILLHAENKSGINQVTTNYSKKVFCKKLGKRDTRVFLNVFPYLFKHRPKVIIHEFTVSIASLLFVIIFTRLFRIKLILWSHGYNRRLGFRPDKRFRDYLRIKYTDFCEAVLLYSQKDKEDLARYIDINKLFVANNTLDTTTLFSIKKKLENEGFDTVKKRLGFTHRYNIIFIGRLIRSKKPEMLITLYENLKDSLDNDIALHFVGDGPLQEEMHEYITGRGYERNVVFHGAIYDDAINSELLYCSDLMVIPGEMGLSINHAFCFDTPVASFSMGKNGPFHGPEIHYVIPGKTGFLAAPYDLDELTALILEYLTDILMQDRVKSNIQELIQKECLIETMAEGFYNCIDSVLKDNP